MDRAWIELLVRDAAGTSTGDDFVAWAERALVGGLDSPALRQLAGLERPSRADARSLFERAAGELGLAAPATNDSLLRRYLAVLAGDILDGTRQPDAALDVIHKHVLGPLNHPADLMEWCYVWEGLDSARGFASLSDAERDAAARALARRTLEQGGW
jgi:hypothetical protein